MKHLKALNQSFLVIDVTELSPQVLRLSLELNEMKNYVEQRVAAKELEFESTKKNFSKALDGLQLSLEDESKGKNEALRQKKKLETDVVRNTELNRIVYSKLNLVKEKSVFVACSGTTAVLHNVKICYTMLTITVYYTEI